MKTCPSCGVEKDATAFGRNKRRPDGLSCYCRDCHRGFPPEAMDFDHVRGTKVAGITQMWSWGRARVLAEIAKCELICANCHRERTVFRMREAA